MDPTKHPWSLEIVDIMAKYGQTPEDFIDSDESDDEDEIGINMDSNFPRHDVANTHYTPKTAKAQLPSLKSRFKAIELAQAGRRMISN